MILKCFCEADSRGNSAAAMFQDARYGYHQRVHNERPKQAKMLAEYRCAVCERVRTRKE